MSVELNAKQHQAATYLCGPLLIDAGAGSGKTRTLAERFVNAVVGLSEENWSPVDIEQVVTITFTEKAAGELAERVRAALRSAGRPDEARRVDSAWISTIHALCSRILRRYALEADLDPYFGIAEGVRAARLEEEAFERIAAQVSQTPGGAALLSAYGYARVRSAVRVIADRLEAHGLDGGDVETEALGNVALLLAEAQSFFENASVRLDACGIATSKNMLKHSEQCATVVSLLSELQVDDYEPQDLAREIRRAIAGYSQKRGVKNAAELCDEIADARAGLIARAAALELQVHAETLCTLVRLHSEAYRQVKQAQGLLDFSDLQRHTLLLLQNHEEIAAGYRRLFKLVMVDEFQDTDALQLALVGEVASDNLCTVGDERQSIYRFRGADIEVYRQHNRAMERAGARRVSLAQNYRSHPDIIGFVNELFSHEVLFGSEDFEPLLPGRLEPELPRRTEGEPRIEIALVHKKGRGEKGSRAAESDQIARSIEGLLDSFEPHECVVLLRTYTHAVEYADALEARGIPVFIVGGSRFFDQPEIAEIRAFCRSVVNGADDEALALFLGSPLAGLRPDALWRLANDPARSSGPGGLWSSATEGVLPDEDDRETLGRALGLLERSRQRLGGVGLAEMILRAVEESNYDLWLLGGAERGRLAYANVLKLARMATEFERVEGRGLAAFLEYLDTKERLGDHERPATLADDHSPGVRIMSIHASKGLEFPVVAVSELGALVRSSSGIVRARVDGSRVHIALSTPADDGSDSIGTPAFDEMDALDKDEEIQEAKRLLYVACTRAEEVLLLSGSANLEKPPTQNTPLAWIRQALDVDGEVGQERSVTRATEGLALGICRVEPEDALEADEEISWGRRSSDDAPLDAPKVPASSGDGVVQNPRSEDMDRLTYSDIEGFKACSLRFMAERLWRVGTLRLEDEGDPRRFGSALHALMRSCLEEAAPVEDQSDRVIERYRLSATEGARLSKVASALFGSRFWVDLDLGREKRAEAPFQIEIADGPEAGFVFAGTMDLYARQGERAVILDYKTGVSGKAEELRSRYEMQARSYALAALRDGCSCVTLEFVRPEVIDEEGEPQLISYEYSAIDAPDIEREIREARAEMLKGPHTPLAAWEDAVCGDCPIAGSLCPLPLSGSAKRCH